MDPVLSTLVARVMVAKQRRMSEGPGSLPALGLKMSVSTSVGRIAPRLAIPCLEQDSAVHLYVHLAASLILSAMTVKSL